MVTFVSSSPCHQPPGFCNPARCRVARSSASCAAAIAGSVADSAANCGISACKSRVTIGAPR